MGVFPKGLVHGFGLKVSVFPSFCFRQKNARKKCFTIFYKEKKSFYALKSSPIDELINPQRFTHKSTDRNALTIAREQGCMWFAPAKSKGAPPQVMWKPGQSAGSISR